MGGRKEIPLLPLVRTSWSSHSRRNSFCGISCDKVGGIGLTLDPMTLERFSNLDGPVIPWICSLCKGHVGMFGTINAPIPSPFPVLKLGSTRWVGKAGVALGGSLVALQQLCPSQSASGGQVPGIPMECGWAGRQGVGSAPRQLLPVWNCYLKP